ncbi:MAG: DUF2920 family protein [Planctomycetia bacterium]|nr:DUF2920 family protein [Planctomycetia bacterium]
MNACRTRLISLIAFIILVFPSIVSAQLKRIGSEFSPGSVAAVVVLGDCPLLHTTQLLPLAKNNGLIGKSDAAVQSAAVVQQLKEVLKSQNVGLDKVVKLNLAAKNLASLESLNQAVSAAFGEQAPAVSVVISDLSHADALVAMDAVVALSSGSHFRVAFNKVSELPQVDQHIGILPPGQRVYISGQAEPGELLEATRKTMASLGKTLESLNLTKASIVQVKAFVNPMSRASEVHQEISAFFDKLPVPPIVCIDWKFETPIEIEVIAWGGAERPGEPLDHITPSFMKSSPVFSRIVRINNGPSVFIGGLHGAAGASPEDQIKDIFKQMQQTLTAAGSDFRHLVKATYLCTEPATIKALGALRPNYYDAKRPPAASLSKINHTGKADTTITLDMIAVPKPTPESLIPKLPETNGSVMIDAQEWPQKPGPRQVQVWVHYPERNRLSSVNAQTGIMLSLHNWGGSYNVGTADPNTLAQRYNVVAVCVDYLQSGAQASIRDPEPYDYGYLQAIDVLRALHFVMSELKAKNIPFDASRIFSTGGSGGGNVSLMANKLAPRTFAGIIDLCGMPKLTDIVAFNLPGSMGLDARYSRDAASPNYLNLDAQEIRFAGHPEHLRLMKTSGTSSKVIVVHGIDDKLFLNEVHELVNNMTTAGLDVEPHFINKEQVDGKVFTTTGHALGNRTLIVQQVADKYLLPTSPTALHRNGPTDFDRRDQVVRYPTKNGVWVISYEAGYPVGRFEASR